jgi:hypothetical protein
MSNEFPEIPAEEFNPNGENKTVSRKNINSEDENTVSAKGNFENAGEYEELEWEDEFRKRVKKKKAIPTKLAAVANLGLDVAQAWAANHPTFTVKFIDYNGLLRQSQAFLNELNQSKNYDGERANNTDNLTTIGKRLTDSLRMFKNYIKAEYDDPIAVKAAYIQHGLIERSTNSYGLPRDNDSRQQVLIKLVAKLQEAGNPFAGKSYGLSHWQQLQTDHQTIWNNSKNTRMGKSDITNNTDAQFKELKNVLSKLRAQIKIDFDGQDVNKVLRTFSFMKENA